MPKTLLLQIYDFQSRMYYSVRKKQQKSLIRAIHFFPLVNTKIIARPRADLFLQSPQIY